MSTDAPKDKGMLLFSVGDDVYDCRNGTYFSVYRISQCGGTEYSRLTSPNHWIPESYLIPAKEARGREKQARSAWEAKQMVSDSILDEIEACFDNNGECEREKLRTLLANLVTGAVRRG